MSYKFVQAQSIPNTPQPDIQKLYQFVAYEATKDDFPGVLLVDTNLQSGQNKLKTNKRYLYREWQKPEFYDGIFLFSKNQFTFRNSHVTIFP